MALSRVLAGPVHPARGKQLVLLPAMECQLALHLDKDIRKGKKRKVLRGMGKMKKKSRIEKNLDKEGGGVKLSEKRDL